MRVAIVAGPYLPIPPLKYGGSEQVIYHLIKGLIELGHEPILLASADSKVDCELIPITNRAIGFAKTPLAQLKHQLLANRIEAKTSKILEKLLPRVDVIHSNGFDLKKFSRFPGITTLHNPIHFADLPYYKNRKQLSYVSISKDQRITFPELNYVSTIYNGEDPASFPIITKPKNYLSFLGRMDADKSPHLAIQLAISLGMKIKLAGKIDHDGFYYFNKEVKPLLSHPLVEWLGELGEKDKIKLVGNAKCNLHPTSFREPFGLTIIEAAYCGTPTLAINRGSIPELIEDGRTGLTIQGFVEGYHRLQECFAMDRQYIAEHSREKFNYQKMTKQYLSAYRKVIRNKSPRRK
ncbi:MAG TPA: glycosyltransferase family 4 protein [Candidatus Saccharimonadales bacterium]|nr:glycosyltransferase family 4 protein [Gammaproteobacteria bacterium]HSX45053.1 glycosyltransferase family 4 protein [Candidatus Saccharimonadales bacterium]